MSSTFKPGDAARIVDNGSLLMRIKYQHIIGRIVIIVGGPLLINTRLDPFYYISPNIGTEEMGPARGSASHTILEKIPPLGDYDNEDTPELEPSVA